MRYVTAFMIAFAGLGLMACNKAPPMRPKSAPPAPRSLPPSPQPRPALTGLEQLNDPRRRSTHAPRTPDKLQGRVPRSHLHAASGAGAAHERLYVGFALQPPRGRRQHRLRLGTRRRTPLISPLAVANEAKAKANLLARRAELAKAAPNHRPTELGPDAYSVTDTGVARVFYVKGQSDYHTAQPRPQDPERRQGEKVVALAKAL